MMGTWDYASCAEFHHLSVCQHYAGTLQHLVHNTLLYILILL